MDTKESISRNPLFDFFATLIGFGVWMSLLILVWPFVLPIKVDPVFWAFIKTPLDIGSSVTICIIMSEKIQHKSFTLNLQESLVSFCILGYGKDREDNKIFPSTFSIFFSVLTYCLQLYSLDIDSIQVEKKGKEEEKEVQCTLSL